MATEQPDPYVVLNIPPTAAQATITAAYRKLAKRLHPDVPETGDRDAFIRLQQAYRLLGDANSRAAYDQSRRPATARQTWRMGEASLGYTRAINWRAPRFIVPMLVGATLLALVQAGAVLLRQPTPTVAIPAVTAGPVTAMGGATVGGATVGAPGVAAVPVVDFAAADHFIGAGSAVPWGNGGRLEPFTPVAMMGAANTARVQVRARDGSTGLVDLSRLLPGDARAARQAACLHLAGAAPRPGQVLLRRGSGPARLVVENREDRPAVLKLRDEGGVAIAAIYIGARGRAELADLPAGPHRVEYALGDVWSTPCASFAAGMRAQALAHPLTLNAETRINLPLAGRDIADGDFARD